MRKVEKFIRDHEEIMCFLAIIYNFFGLNKIKGRKTLKINQEGVFFRKTKILNYGKNNTLSLGKGCRIYNSKIQFFGNNNLVVIEHDCVLKDVDIWISDGSIIEVGHNTYFTGDIHIACIEGKKVHIGERCLFSNQITFRTGDSHSILNKEGQRINYADDIWVGDHVWVGQQVIVLKGASIGNESVIGTRALVTGKKFQQGAIIAGVPAKVIKEEINWDHRLL